MKSAIYNARLADIEYCCGQLRIPGQLSGLIWAFLMLVSLPSWSQLPELSAPSTLSGEATSAKFFAGSTPDKGTSYPTVVGFSVPVDISAEIQVEDSHVASVGNLYILVVLGEEVYQRNGPELYELWDGTVENLRPAITGKSLQSIEVIPVVESLAFGPAGIADATLEFYFAYDTAAAPGKLFFNGLPLALTIQAEDAIPASQTFYTESVSATIVQARCLACHTSTGIASTSGLIMQAASEPGSQLANYNTLIEYIQNAPNGAERIVAKPQGLESHGGGVVLASDTTDLSLWLEFVELATLDIAVAGGGVTTTTAAIFDNVVFMNGQETLRKASLLFAGRLPTKDELALAAGDEASLRDVIRGLMTGDGFSQFLIESANDRLLTEAFSSNLFSIVDRKYYPNSAKYFGNPGLRSEATVVAASLAQEPLRLIEYVVTQDKPYSEILTADYTMMNPFAAEIYNSSLSFDDPQDFSDWKPAEITDYFRCSDCDRGDDENIYDIPTDYPHAGVLNSPAFLSRYPSTETNRNRARARWAYYYFLGVDIEAISERTTDEAALQDENNPTLNNPNCVVCHDIMDPVAGAFQNYSDSGFYRNQPGGNDSLPFSYKRDRQGGYQDGDTWYSDMLLPGFGELIAPSADNSIQWLAQEFVNDSRFGDGTVSFWFPSIIGREPYPEPENPGDADYAAKLAAFNGEQAMINEVASNFLSGAAGNGSHNLKDLLVDLVMSDQFRAESLMVVAEQAVNQDIELEDVGSGKLLSPEQLNRKILDTTGYDWRYGNLNALEDVYNLIYGGIDSFGITERARELTTLMSSVVTTMANETSCAIVNNDFSKSQSQRKLFPFVELTTTPTTGASAIRSNIQHLHKQLLGEDLSADSVEISASYNLFTDVRESRLAQGKTAAVSTANEFCITSNIESPIISDPNQTLRSWAAVINYLMRDYRFHHE